MKYSLKLQKTIWHIDLLKAGIFMKKKLTLLIGFLFGMLSMECNATPAINLKGTPSLIVVCLTTSSPDAQSISNELCNKSSEILKKRGHSKVEIVNVGDARINNINYLTFAIRADKQVLPTSKQEVILLSAQITNPNLKDGRYIPAAPQMTLLGANSKATAMNATNALQKLILELGL